MERISFYGNIILKDKIIKDGILIIEGGKIDFVGEKNKINIDHIDYDFKEDYISPGFIDIHIHGSIGKDFLDCEYDDIETLSLFLAQNGVTSFLPTIVTAPLEDMKKAIEKIELYIQNQKIGAKVLGIHIEGPFLNPKYKGAQREDCIIKPDLDILRYLLSSNLKIMTLAPELEGTFELIKYLVKNNVIVSAGHTDATLDITKKAKELGLSNITHLFNGMRPLHHREPGIVGTALIEDELSVELIADGFHLADTILKLVYKTKPKDKIILVTDAMMAAGLNDGEYSLAGQKVLVKDGKATLESGSLAGSTLRMNKAVKNFKEKVGVKLEDAVYIASYSPAKLLGVENKKGSLEVGKDADIIIFDKDLNIKMTIVEGKIVYKK